MTNPGKKRNLLCRLLPLCAIFALPFMLDVFALTADTHAIVSDENLYKLSLIQAVNQCYKLSAKSEIKLGDFSNYLSIFNTGNGNWTGDGKIVVTTGIGNTLNDYDLSCSQAFAGYPSGNTNATKNNSARGITAFYTLPDSLNGLGYYFDHNEGGTSDSKSGTADADSDQVTIKFNYIKDATNQNTNPVVTTGAIVCNGEQKYHNGWVYKYYYWDVTSCTGQLEVTYNGEIVYHLEVLDEYGPQFYHFSNYDIQVWSYNYDAYGMYAASPSQERSNKFTDRHSLADAFTNSYFTKAIQNNVNDILQQNLIYTEAESAMSVATTTPTSNTQDNSNSVYKPISNVQSAAGVALKNMNISFSDNPSISDGSISAGGNHADTRSYYWSADWKYSLYYRYLTKIMEEYPDININQCDSNKPTSAAYYFKNSASEWCVINIPASASTATSKSLAVVGTLYLQKGTFATVLNWFKDDSSYQYMTDAGYANAEVSPGGELEPDPIDPGGTVTPATQQASCYDNAGSLGWIICPITETLSGVIQKIYQYAVEPALQLKPALFNGESGTYEAWKIFRDMANIAFIIIFLFVIFSQLTGIGIDNYGIKKALPKLVIGAVLINASFVICQFAVDVANIVGTGVRGLLDGVTTQVQVNSIGLTDINDNPVTVPESVWNGGLLLVGLIALISVGAFLAIGPSVLIPVFLAAISVLVAIGFLFIVLYTRQALAVLLVAVSPLAFVMYILPNTKSVFDKWFKLFKGMLIAYPICSALIYGGNMAAAILTTAASQTHSLVIALSAIVVSIIPIFLIPRAIQGSMGALGQIAGRLQARASGGARGAYRNSGIADDQRFRGRLHRAGYSLDRDGNVRDRRIGFGRASINARSLREKVAFGAGAKSRLSSRRAALVQENTKRQTGNAFIGAGGTRKAQAQMASAKAARESQDVQDEISAMTSDYGGDFEKMVSGTDVFDQDGNVVRHAAGLNELLDKDTLTDEETLRLNALATYMANNAGSDGKKALGKAMTSDHKQSQALARYAATGDSSVMGAIGDKNVYAQQYAKDLAAGRTKSNFKTWLDEGKAGDNKGKNGAPRTNRQFITQEVLDDNDKLLSQSGDARSIAFQAKDDNGSYVISESRLQGALANEELMKLHPEALSDMQQNGRTLYGKSDETFSQEYFAPNPNNGGRVEKRTRMVHRTADGTLIDSDGNVVQGTEKTLDQNGNIVNGNKIDSRKDTIVESASYRRKGQTSGSQVLHRMADGTFRTDRGVTVPNIADFERLGQ